MKPTASFLTLSAAVLLGATPAFAQQAQQDTTSNATSQPPTVIQHLRPVSQSGINMFEPPKQDTVPYKGFRLQFGFASTQQFQDLKHSNTASPKIVNNVDQNELIKIGAGFNNAVANVYLNAQLAKGIRVALTSFLSSRHHQETWVKDGYLLIDDVPFNNPLLQSLMKNLTIKAGHFEVNYGDQHFRRTDNGNAMYNPFVGNLILDAFTTEIGGEVYLRKDALLAMASVTGGEIHGQVTAPEKRSPSYIGKLGFDQQFDKTLRVRLTGSMYYTKKSASNTLYTGDRAGSRYYDVLENTQSTESSQAWSGAIRPGLSNNVKAFVINPFVKIHGLELFGNLEQAKGAAATETKDRTWNQYSGEAIYRFLPREQLYIGGRYNTAKGELSGITNKVSVNRTQIAGGWFLTPGILTKVEYVNQKYNDFPTTDIRNGGKFHGVMVEGVVAF